MATFTTAFLVFGSALLLTTSNAIPDQHTGILASLYKKAAQEKRPLILVLDKSLKQNPLTSQPLERATRPPHSVKKQTPSLNSYSGQKLPYLLLQNLKKLQSKPQPSKSIFNTFLNYERQQPKIRLPFHIDRNDRDKAYDPDEYHSLRILIKKEKPGTRSRGGIDGKALRNSIALSVLRQSNGNCDMIDDCDPRDNSCEVKVECEESKEEVEEDECRFSETCAQNDELISTKGLVENF